MAPDPRIDPTKTVRGQYRGYVDEPGVEPGSDVDTFVALAARDRLVALGRRAVAGAHRQDAAGHRHRGRGHVRGAAPAAVLAVGRGPPRPQPAAVPARPQRRGDPAAPDQVARRRPRQRPVDLEVSYEAAVPAPAGGLPAPARGRHGGRPPPLRPGRRRRGAVAHRRRGPHPRPAVELYRSGTWGPPAPNAWQPGRGVGRAAGRREAGARSPPRPAPGRRRPRTGRCGRQRWGPCWPPSRTRRSPPSSWGR